MERSEHEEFFDSLNVADRADLLSEMLPGAQDFLEAVPNKSLGLAFEPEEFVVELKRRLLAPVYASDHFCPCCDGICDSKGRHPGLCSGKGDRVLRHNNARNLVGRFAASGGFSRELEKPGLLPPGPNDVSPSLRRPADVYVPSWSHGAPAAFDFAVSSAQRQNALAQAFRVVGAAPAYEETKKSHLDTAAVCAAQGLTFVPLVAEPSGGWGPTGVTTLKRLARAVDLKTGEPAGSARVRIFQQLSVALRRASARAILRRQADETSVEPPCLASARLLLDSLASSS